MLSDKKLYHIWIKNVITVFINIRATTVFVNRHNLLGYIRFICKLYKKKMCVNKTNYFRLPLSYKVGHWSWSWDLRQTLGETIGERDYGRDLREKCEEFSALYKMSTKGQRDRHRLPLFELLTEPKIHSVFHLKGSFCFLLLSIASRPLLNRHLICIQFW